MFLTSAAKTYQIYMVTNVNSNSPNFVIFKDLLQAMKDHEFGYISKTEFSGKMLIKSEESKKQEAQAETSG